MKVPPLLQRLVSILVCGLLLNACSEDPEPPIKIAINPWPGYEFLYLAEQQGYFDQLDLNIQLLQLSSLADVQRAYINGYADGLTSTMIEAVQVQSISDRDLSIVMVTDYSDGGDVIIASKGIRSVKDLKGKRVGAEVSSLGIFVLQRALAKNGLTLSDVQLLNVEQSKGKEKIANKGIDAFVSYPPASIDILNNTESHQIFSSSEIPGEIIDIVAISNEVLNANPMLVEKLRKAWQQALDYYEKEPIKAAKIMASREGISVEEFQQALGDLRILDSTSQEAIFKAPQSLDNSVRDVCRILSNIQSIEEDCETFPNMIYQATP